MTTFQLTPWQFRKLILFFGLIGLWYGSWIFPPTANIWLTLDTLAFYHFNHLLAAGRPVHLMFAYMNQPWFDSGMVVFLALPCLVPGLVFPRENYMSSLRCLLLVIFIAYQIKYIWVWLIAIERVSPSLIFHVDYILPNLVPDLRHVKFISKNSFPADHGAIILTWLIFMLCYAKRYWRYLAMVIAIVLSLPRLASGAHWLSDVLVGGLAVALISLALVSYTPLRRLW